MHNRKKVLLKKSEKTLKSHLKNYKVKFFGNKDLDELWSEKDDDKNGWLDKFEAEKFVKEVARIIDQDRAKNFDMSEFPKLFEKFDEDKNGYLSKGEMAQFIKIVFKGS